MNFGHFRRTLPGVCKRMARKNGRPEMGSTEILTPAACPFWRISFSGCLATISISSHCGCGVRMQFFCVPSWCYLLPKAFSLPNGCSCLHKSVKSSHWSRSREKVSPTLTAFFLLRSSGGTNPVNTPRKCVWKLPQLIKCNNLRPICYGRPSPTGRCSLSTTFLPKSHFHPLVILNVKKAKTP